MRAHACLRWPLDHHTKVRIVSTLTSLAWLIASALVGWLLCGLLARRYLLRADAPEPSATQDTQIRRLRAEVTLLQERLARRSATDPRAEHVAARLQPGRRLSQLEAEMRRLKKAHASEAAVPSLRRDVVALESDAA
jgi:hypothetical protein